MLNPFAEVGLTINGCHSRVPRVREDSRTKPSNDAGQKTLIPSVSWTTCGHGWALTNDGRRTDPGMGGNQIGIGTVNDRVRQRAVVRKS
jgi:hypothetical protein